MTCELTSGSISLKVGRQVILFGWSILQRRTYNLFYLSGMEVDARSELHGCKKVYWLELCEFVLFCCVCGSSVPLLPQSLNLLSDRFSLLYTPLILQGEEESESLQTDRQMATEHSRSGLSVIHPSMRTPLTPDRRLKCSNQS